MRFYTTRMYVFLVRDWMYPLIIREVASRKHVVRWCTYIVHHMLGVIKLLIVYIYIFICYVLRFYLHELLNDNQRHGRLFVSHWHLKILKITCLTRIILLVELMCNIVNVDIYTVGICCITLMSIMLDV